MAVASLPIFPWQVDEKNHHRTAPMSLPLAQMHKQSAGSRGVVKNHGERSGVSLVIGRVIGCRRKQYATCKIVLEGKIVRKTNDGLEENLTLVETFAGERTQRARPGDKRATSPCRRVTVMTTRRLLTY